MGSVKRDIYKTGRQYDEDYAYNEDGIASLLKDIYRLSERKWFKGDVDATTILTDLYMALDSDCLTPRMRQVVALYYFAQLTEEDTAKILILTRQTVSESLESALLRLSSEIENGGANRKGRGTSIYAGISPVYVWLNNLAEYKSPPYSVPDDVITSLLEIQWDNRAREVLRQRELGIPFLVEEYAEGDEYRCLTEDQFKWRDRRMSFVSDIKFENSKLIGYRKSAHINNDDEWSYSKQRVFAS